VAVDRLAIVTDAIAGLGMPTGRYRLAELNCIVDGESARLPGGGLAGSVLGMDRAVSNLAVFAGIPEADATLAATVVPARLLGVVLQP
jgi:N-acetylglucosamine-6-phosphate deacetylase